MQKIITLLLLTCAALAQAPIAKRLPGPPTGVSYQQLPMPGPSGHHAHQIKRHVDRKRQSTTVKRPTTNRGKNDQ